MAVEQDANSGASPLRVFGAELRHYRTRAGMSQEQLGARVYCSADLIGKIENGQRAPAEELAAACDAVPELGTGGALTRLRELLRDYLKQRAYPGWFHRWPDKEAEAKTLRWFELVAVPGLLQTKDYARAMLRTQVMASDDEIAEMVRARLDRQLILERDVRPMLWVILDVGVLRRPVGGTSAMRGQLARLADAARRPNVVVQVIPLSAGAHQGMSGNFVIADFADAPPCVYQDTAARGQIIEDPDDIAAVTTMWDTLHSEALPRAASLELVEETATIWT
jgi:transcriptional regulator with XRE-family HTH domain